MSNGATFRLPDLWSDCPFPPVFHKNGAAIATASEKWIRQGIHELTDDIRRHIDGLDAGTLVAYSYNECSDDRLRVICDFTNVLFLLDDLSDPLMVKDAEIFADVIMKAMTFPGSYRPINAKGMDQPELESDASRLTRDYCKRLIPNMGPYVLQRWIQNMELYLIAVKEQAQYRDQCGLPPLEEFIELRRLSTACRPLFDLLEYSLDMELPEHVVENPLMIAIKDYVNDYIGFSNDLFSYNVEQARNDDHNLVAVLMNEYNIDLQGAVDRVGEMCREVLDKYCVTKAQFPSYGPELDEKIEAFFRGLESWMSGNLHWSFISQRYFGTQGPAIKKHCWVKLLPAYPDVQEKAT